MKKIEQSNFSLIRELPLYIEEYIQMEMADHPESDFKVSYSDYGLEYGFEEEIEKVLEKKKWVDTYENRGIISKLITDIVTSSDSYDFPKKLNYSESGLLKKYTAYQKSEITRQIKKDFFRVKYAKEFVSKELKHLDRIKDENRELNSLKFEMNKLEGSYSVKGKNDLLNLDPIKFEHYVAKFFERKGYNSNVTLPSNDGGYDIILTHTNREKYLVQCKRYRGTVSSPELRNFLGTLVYNNVEKGFVVTTGKFSAEAKKIASSHNITLINGKQLGHELASKKYQKDRAKLKKK